MNSASAHPQVSIKKNVSTTVSNHPEYTKSVETLPFPSFSVNLDFQESRAHSQSHLAFVMKFVLFLTQILLLCK